MRSTHLNRFYHSVLHDIHRKALAEHLTVEQMDFLKQGLKKLDENYPKVEDNPLSSSKLTNKQLCEHLEFIVAYIGQYGISPHYVEDDWSRMIKEARNAK